MKEFYFAPYLTCELKSELIGWWAGVLFQRCFDGILMQQAVVYSFKLSRSVFSASPPVYILEMCCLQYCTESAIAVVIATSDENWFVQSENHDLHSAW